MSVTSPNQHTEWQGPGALPEHSGRVGTSLPVRVEFARQISQWRVRVVLIVLAVLPIVIRLAFLLGGGRATEDRIDLAGLAQASGVTFTAFVLLVSGGILFTLIVALLFGDMIAGEASRSTLKYLLTIPVPRARLLFVKVLVSSAILVAGILLLVAVSLIVGTISYGTDGLQVPGGPELGLGQSLVRIAGAAGMIGVRLLWAAALGTLLTVVTDAPLAAAGGVVITSIISSILGAIEDLGDLRYFLPTWNGDAFEQFFMARIDYGPIGDAMLSSLVYSLVFGVAATLWFARKNISS